MNSGTETSTLEEYSFISLIKPKGVSKRLKYSFLSVNIEYALSHRIFYSCKTLLKFCAHILCKTLYTTITVTVNLSYSLWFIARPIQPYNTRHTKTN